MPMRRLPGQNPWVNSAERIPDMPKPGEEPDRRLVLEVIFTYRRRTVEALDWTLRLARGLEAKIKLIHAQQVPMAFPIDRPPVDVAFTKSQLMEIAHRAAHHEVEVQAQLYLCRDRSKSLSEVLKPSSLVILGGKDRWWLTPESRLAKLLAKKGHRVILLRPK